MNFQKVLRLNNVTKYLVRRNYSGTGKPLGGGGGGPSSSAYNKPSKSAAEESIKSNVAGLSKNCIKPITSPVGPGASATGNYKVPEYFCYNKMSYAEAEVEMANFRLPQPKAR